ncbi:aconitate hydratase AcnA [Pinisolibacter aquiterrae]|uniref:aconitate hydratase AcnA n=1 Tax=Pinisolibacter aquiterrae TaxID=2815579 RepID=UPI001C3DD006|nr:aconitate hydratase AcnA [Pinisolibacter aquiterrae]MBV5262516.1 aconitate hydratase AcnA [Pinisolibacter aquiterrae]MCC8235850.1 aconitate hydratase AcnA [Pinisolibacter aquiterrae]
MIASHPDTFSTRRTVTIGGRPFVCFDLATAEANGLSGLSRLPFSLKVLAENLLRHEDGRSVTADDLRALAAWGETRGRAAREIAYRPARVLMQDFTGVPAVVDLAAMRDAVVALGGSPDQINPQIPVDLVVDHSVVVDYFGNASALSRNVAREYEQNQERYTFLKWGQKAFRDFRVVPPGTGICHQVNLEYLARVVWTRESADGTVVTYPDTCVGTDSHTTMVGGLGVLGWGVGGIEAEAAMLGQPVSMLIPEVIGFRLSGRLREGVTSTDLVLTVTQMLRKKGVVGKFVEFFGPGLSALGLADRATIGNMAPEYGATCGFFPVDAVTLDYLRLSGRSDEQVALVEAYTRAQGLFRDETTADPLFTDTLELDLTEVEPSLAGPKRPEGRVALGSVPVVFDAALAGEYRKPGEAGRRWKVEGTDFDLGHGDVVIAAVTSCTNTSNPSVLVAAGLLARKARERGLRTKPWVKTSLAPGSQVVAAYLKSSGLQDDLDALGFQIVGFGCTTCIGNSGPLDPAISRTIAENGIVASAVLSGNRNFEGRISPDVQANWLASPPLVVAHALAGSTRIDLTREPLGMGADGKPVFLSDIWPSTAEIDAVIAKHVTGALFREKYAEVFAGDERWRAVEVTGGETYAWDDASTYVRNPPYFEGMTRSPPAISDVKGARILALLGDKITTDHISPAGSIKPTSPAGRYLLAHGVEPRDFNQYGTRRGNHEVMIRGTFANIRIKNAMVRDEAGAIVEGGFTVHQPSGERVAIYDAARRYADEGVPLVVFAGVEYGNGSSRDWAAKGTRLLGVKAVVARSYERIHRSNLVGMGVLPLQFEDGTGWETLGLTGAETVSIGGLTALAPRAKLTLDIVRADGSRIVVPVTARIDTADELDYFRNGGILPAVLRHLVDARGDAR